MFPSETETLGLVAIEAMSAGLPVVAVSARGIKYFCAYIIVKPGRLEGYS